MTRIDAVSTPATSCDLAAFTDLVRSAAGSKLPSRFRGVEQTIRAHSGARSRDRDSAPLRRRRRAPSIPMRSHTRQLLGRLRKPSFAKQKQSLRFVLDVSKRASK